MSKSENRAAEIQQRIKRAMRSHRLSKGWTGKRMAEVLGVSEDSYEKYESEKPDPKTGKTRKVPTDVIVEFCDQTDTDLNWIMLGRKQLRKAV
jgi:DNA-binding XRE family transcriptional regulator